MNNLLRNKTELSLRQEKGQLPKLPVSQRVPTKTHQTKTENLYSESRLLADCNFKFSTPRFSKLRELLADNNHLISKEFQYNSDYNYFEIQDVIKEDLCFTNLQTMIPKLPTEIHKLPRMTKKMVHVEKLKKIFATEIMKRKLITAFKISPEIAKENSSLPLVSQSKPMSHRKSYLMDPTFHIPKFNIETTPVNENPVPTRMNFTMHFNSSRIFVFGGFGRKMFAQCLIYDLTNHRMSVFKSLFFKRARHSSVKIGHHIILHGGVILENYMNRFTLSDTVLFDIRLLIREPQRVLDKTCQQYPSSSQKVPCCFCL
jgi:hypothetical protein